MSWRLHTDGGSRGNPGPAGCGICLEHDGRTVVSAGWYLGTKTNNYAEYSALIWGLRNARELGARELEVYADSELMVKQMNGDYKVKNADMKKLYARAIHLVDEFESVTYTHVRRNLNKEADARANDAMDARGPVGEYACPLTDDEDASGTASMFVADSDDAVPADVAQTSLVLTEDVSSVDEGQTAIGHCAAVSETSDVPTYEGRTVLVGVTGCIAAYKACELVRCLQKDAPGLNVKVVMTEHAAEFVGATTFRALTGNEVAVGLFDDPSDPIHHISLAKEADVFCIAPATANVIAKVASGIADDLLTTTALASEAPLVVAPAMNLAMWADAATRDSMRILQARGARIVGPASGYQACGDTGTGRMEEPQAIADAVIDALATAHDLEGVHLLVTAGPTYEALDPVRYLGNRSSGRQGYAIAAEARMRGADVTLVSGPVALAEPEGVEVVHVESAEQMLAACEQPFARCDAAIFTAAVSDWRPARPAAKKIKHDGGGLALDLVPNPDIAATLSADKGERYVVAFAAETGNPVQAARVKLVKKNADLVVGNDVSTEGLGFGSEDNHVWFVDADEVHELPTSSKRELARHILDSVAEAKGTR